MKKLAFAALSALMLIALAACNENGITQGNRYEDILYDPALNTYEDQNADPTDIPISITNDKDLTPDETDREPEESVADFWAMPVSVRILAHETQILPPYSVDFEFDYAGFWRYEGSFDFDGIGETLVITTDRPVRNLQVIRIEITEFGNMDVLETMFIIPEFLPTQVLLINSYFDKGTFPHSGISFSDEDGTLQRFFILQQSQETGDFHLWESEVNYLAADVWMP